MKMKKRRLQNAGEDTGDVGGKMVGMKIVNRRGKPTRPGRTEKIRRLGMSPGKMVTTKRMRIKEARTRRRRKRKRKIKTRKKMDQGTLFLFIVLSGIIII